MYVLEFCHRFNETYQQKLIQYVGFYLIYLTMARLCKEMDHMFSEHILKNLQLRGIWTVEDFLKENPKRLVAITHLSCKDIEQTRNDIIAKFSALSSDGVAMYKELQAKSIVVSSGIRCLDFLLGGGFLTGCVYEVCGSSGCCKSQICHTISMSVALNQQQKAYYIDAKMEFSYQRLISAMTSRRISENEIVETLKRIEVVRVKNVFELFSVLQAFWENLTKRDFEVPFTRFIVIDSLPAIFFPLMSESSNEGIALMSHFANMVKRIAVEFQVAFLIVNLATVFTDEIDEFSELDSTSMTTELLTPAFGKYWFHVPSTRLLVNSVNSQIHISIIKSTNEKLGSSCSASISDRGVE